MNTASPAPATALTFPCPVCEGEGALEVRERNYDYGGWGVSHTCWCCDGRAVGVDRAAFEALVDAFVEARLGLLEFVRVCVLRTVGDEEFDLGFDIRADGTFVRGPRGWEFLPLGVRELIARTLSAAVIAAEAAA